MNTSLRQLLGIASMFGAGVAFAGHGDADTGYYSYESIALADRIVVASVPASGSGQPKQQAAPATGTCRMFDLPGLDVLLWTIPCEGPAPMAHPPRMCRVFDLPGLDVLLWTEPCDMSQSARAR